MEKIFFTSDTHFGHNKEFLYKGRGFESVEEHAEKIVENWNKVVSPRDTVYHLGDISLSPEYEEKSIEWVRRLNGNIMWIRGNHDSDRRVEKFLVECDNICYCSFVEVMKMNKINLYLSHYPTITINPLDSAEAVKRTIVFNLHGHTHQKEIFNPQFPRCCYHVGLDSHNLTPVSWDEVREDLMKVMVDIK